MSAAGDPIDLVGAAARDEVPVLGGDDTVELLRTARRIAIVGASAHEWRASHSVMDYLLEQGYDCVPVTPMASEILGRPCHPTLEAATAEGGPFDIVDVFRRPEFAPEIARSAVRAGLRRAVAADSRRQLGRCAYRPRGRPEGGHGPLHRAWTIGACASCGSVRRAPERTASADPTGVSSTAQTSLEGPEVETPAATSPDRSRRSISDPADGHGAKGAPPAYHASVVDEPAEG